MKLHSKYFDRIRINPDRVEPSRDLHPPCAWRGCAGAGTHRAPKGRGHDGEYLHFCLDHVRQYNKSYNYFSGMSDADIGQYQRSAVTGHRPTWSMGYNPWSQAHTGGTRDGGTHMGGFSDPFNLFSGGHDPHAKPRPQIRNAERKALTALGLDETAQGADIKAQYKTLVKRHHPDANGGGKAAEAKLREIIQAYDYLKRVGFC